MAQHIRHANREQHDRAVVKFTRPDLLWRGQLGPREVPFKDGTRTVGPTVLDVVMRRPAERVSSDEGQGDNEEASCSAVWSMRTAADFMERDPSRRVDLHPFKVGLVSGGRVVDVDDEFVHVEKTSSVSISAYAFRLAVGTLGSVDAAYASIAAKATLAWRADLARSRALFDAVREAPHGRLEETEELAKLRPAGSISDQIETEVLREACVMLGVDPDMHIRRPPGRPGRAAAGDTEQGDFIAVMVVDGVVSAKTIRAIAGIPAQAELSTLAVLKLVALLDALVQGGAEADADLLEAYLDAVAPEWRESVGGASAASAAASDDPYSILGVQRGMPLDEITVVYRRAMQAMHPDKGACPPWFAQAAGAAYRKIKQELAGSSTA